MRSRRCTNRPRRSTPGLHDVLDWIDPSVDPNSTCRCMTPREPTMHVHPTISMHLDEHERNMIEIAVEILDDGFLTEIAARLHDELPPAGPTVSYLPQRYDDLYDLALLRRWYICFLVVTERLANGWTPLRCRGEELALRAIIECAREQLELNRLERDDSFFDLENALFEDLDHLILWHPEMDGIDDPETMENQRLGVAPLHPSTWFDPIDPSRPVHPLLRVG